MPIYLDYHATTPVDPRALEAMLPYFTEHFGNAASGNHAYGWKARRAVEAAREQIGAIVGAPHRDIVFTSGATESNNLAIKGIARAHRARGRHVVTVATEHQSVLDSVRYLEREGFECTRLPVDRDGLVDPDRLAAALRSDTLLVSVMAANNEIGVVQPLAAIADAAHARGAVFHTDASQAVGRVPFDVEACGADLVSFTAHKMYGPKGAGALYVRRAVAAEGLEPLLHGGGHERGMRSGTLNVPGLVGFGAAAELAREALPEEGPRLAALRDRLLAGLRARVPDVRVNGSLADRVPGNLNVSFPAIEAESLAVALDDIAVSSGSACSSSKSEPSHVLTALGLDRDLALSSIRFGLGRWSTAEEVDYAVEKVAGVVAGLRELRARL